MQCLKLFIPARDSLRHCITEWSGNALNLLSMAYNAVVAVALRACSR